MLGIIGREAECCLFQRKHLQDSKIRLECNYSHGDFFSDNLISTIIRCPVHHGGKPLIISEILPELIRQDGDTGIEMSSEVLDSQWDQTIVKDTKTGQILATAKQDKNPRHLVRFFQGKGGFCSVITGDEVTYFSLPGSEVLLLDTEVILPGELITGKPKDLLSAPTVSPVQTITHQAMILGAGLATRFEPISGDMTERSKPGVPLIGEDSVIACIAKHLRQHGFSKILVNTFYKPHALKAQLSCIEGVEIDFIDEEAPSGTAGGLAKAIEEGLVDLTQPIFIIQGDAITDADLSLLLQTHQDRNAAVTIGGQIVRDEDVHKFGIIQTDGVGGDEQSGNIISFKEKPQLEHAGKSRFANAGFYVIAPEAYPLFMAANKKPHKTSGLYDYAQDFFPEVLEATQQKRITHRDDGTAMTFWAQALSGYWSDIGNPSQYIEALRDIYAGVVKMCLPAESTFYYDNHIIYWPGAKEKVNFEEARLSGNIIVVPKA